MPLDTSLALQTQGPADPLERCGKALALKNLIQQGKSQDLGLQQQQMDFDDQQKLKQAYTESGGDLIKTKQRAMQLGVNPKTLIKLESDVLTQAKDMAELDDKKYTALKSKNELVGGKLYAVLASPEADQPAAYQAARAELLQQGLVDPAHAPEQFPGTAGLKEMANRTRTGQQMLDISDKIREAALKEREVKASESNAASTASNALTTSKRETREGDQTAFQNAISDLAGNPPANPAEYNARIGKLPPAVASRILQAVPVGAYDPAKSAVALRKMGMSPQEQTQADQAAGNAAQTKAYQEAEVAQGKQRIGLSQQEMNLRNKEYQQKYGDVLAQLSPEQKSLAEKLAAGDLNPMQLRGMGDKEKLMAGAIAINPAWTQATYDTKQSFTNPEKSQAKNLATISRIVGHIGRFEENSKKAGFSPLYATGTNLTGDAKVLAEDGHAIAAEFEKLVSGGVGTEGQTKSWQSMLQSPATGVRQRAIDEISQLIGSQYEGMNQTYKNGTGADLPTEKYLTGPGREWLKSKGINVNGAAAGSPAATPAAYSQTATGPSGHKIGSNDGGKTWVDVKTGKPI